MPSSYHLVLPGTPVYLLYRRVSAAALVLVVVFATGVQASVITSAAVRLVVRLVEPTAAADVVEPYLSAAVGLSECVEGMLVVIYSLFLASQQSQEETSLAGLLQDTAAGTASAASVKQQGET